MHISLADFTAEDFLTLIRDYLAFAHQDACTHALGLEELKGADVRMFTARDETGALMGCAALKTLSPTQGEIKSVRTHPDHLRKGVSRNLMSHLETTARKAGLKTLYLETHNTPQYAAACRLYEVIGYEYCGPFGEYEQNPRNVFMKKAI